MLVSSRKVFFVALPVGQAKQSRKIVGFLKPQLTGLGGGRICRRFLPLNRMEQAELTIAILFVALPSWRWS